MNENFINVGACIAKIGIDMSNLSDDKKIFLKGTIDFGAEIEKVIAKHNRLNQKNALNTFKDIAEKYDIDKIVTFPAKVLDQEFRFTRIYGEKYADFAHEAGIMLVDSYLQQDTLPIFEEAEKKYGQILYEKKK